MSWDALVDPWTSQKRIVTTLRSPTMALPWVAALSFEAKPAGIKRSRIESGLFLGSSVCSTFNEFPQLLQKFTPAGLECWQLGQIEARRCPQFEQYWAVSGLLAWQLGQFIIGSMIIL
jgi:hypothetical protein